MPFSAGQTFLFPLSLGQKSHLWIIVTNPDADGLFLTVSLTSLKGSKDQTVLLRAGDHPFVKWDTCVAYALSDLRSEEKLQSLIACGAARMHSDLRSDLVALIFDGFLASDFTKRRITDFVKHVKQNKS